jgi:hypothetical protein
MKLVLVSSITLLASLAAAASGPNAEAPKAAPQCAQSGPVQAGSQHAQVQKLAGTWDAVIILRDPQGAEVRSHGTLTREKHTAFHTVDRFEGEFMGMPFVGQGLNGYCPLRQQYFAFWTDSMTPSPMMLYGNYDAKTRELALSGECFGMSGKLEKCRTLAHFTDDDHWTWTMFGAGPDGKEIQHLRVEYTRNR